MAITLRINRRGSGSQLGATQVVQGRAVGGVDQNGSRGSTEAWLWDRFWRKSEQELLTDLTWDVRELRNWQSGVAMYAGQEVCRQSGIVKEEWKGKEFTLRRGRVQRSVLDVHRSLLAWQLNVGVEFRGEVGAGDRY